MGYCWAHGRYRATQCPECPHNNLRGTLTVTHKLVRHDDELAKVLADAAGMSSKDYLKRSSVKLAKQLGLKLPMQGEEKP